MCRPPTTRSCRGGTAFISDVGMTGDYDSVIGMDKDEPLNRFLRRIPSGRFEPATGPATLCAIAVETDDATGLARRIARCGSAAGSNRRGRISGTRVLATPPSVRAEFAAVLG